MHHLVAEDKQYFAKKLLRCMTLCLEMSMDSRSKGDHSAAEYYKSNFEYALKEMNALIDKKYEYDNMEKLAQDLTSNGLAHIVEKLHVWVD